MVRGLIGLVRLQQWAHARCFEHIPALRRFGNLLLDTIRYLELNADSLPDYGSRFRSGTRISTGFAESAVNEIIAKRMNKKQQMRWNRHTVQDFSDVRVHVLNGTLEGAFRFWHEGFRPTSDLPEKAAAAWPPHKFECSRSSSAPGPATVRLGLLSLSALFVIRRSCADFADSRAANMTCNYLL